MPYKKILKEDWSEYDNRKIIDRKDRDFFSCTQKWETDFLVGKIKKAYPALLEHDVRRAIADCCQALKKNHLRSEFVFNVMRKLEC